MFPPSQPRAWNHPAKPCLSRPHPIPQQVRGVLFRRDPASPLTLHPTHPFPRPDAGRDLLTVLLGSPTMACGLFSRESGQGAPMSLVPSPCPHPSRLCPSAQTTPPQRWLCSQASSSDAHRPLHPHLLCSPCGARGQVTAVPVFPVCPASQVSALRCRALPPSFPARPGSPCPIRAGPAGTCSGSSLGVGLGTHQDSATVAAQSCGPGLTKIRPVRRLSTFPEPPRGQEVAPEGHVRAVTAGCMRVVLECWVCRGEVVRLDL